MSLEFNAPDAAMNYVVDDIGTVVSRIRERWVTADRTDITADNSNLTVDGDSAPFYMYGHKLEVVRELLKKNKTFRKYPLIYLVMDFPEKRGSSIIELSLNIGIISHTKQEYNASQRYTNVFKTTLYPLYKMFLEELKNSGLFFWPEDQKEPVHLKIDRPFWGTEGPMKNEKHIFTDPIDCIELRDLTLNQTIKSTL